MQERSLSGRPRDSFLLGYARESSLELSVEPGGSGGQGRCGVGQRYGEDVCLDRLRLPRAQLDPHGGAMLSEPLSTLREKVSQALNDLRHEPDHTERVSSLRPPTSGAPPDASAKSVEVLQSEIGVRCAERQRLRAAGAGEGELEQNRLEISRLQWELSHALIVRHGRTAAA